MPGFNYRFDMGFNGEENVMPIATNPGVPTTPGDRVVYRNALNALSIGTLVTVLNNLIANNDDWSDINTNNMFRFEDTYTINNRGFITAVTTRDLGQTQPQRNFGNNFGPNFG